MSSSFLGCCGGPKRTKPVKRKAAGKQVEGEAYGPAFSTACNSAKDQKFSQEVDAWAESEKQLHPENRYNIDTARDKIQSSYVEKQTKLCLSCLELTCLPESIGQLENLETLNLTFNQLAALPESIGQLGNLKTLELSINQLAALPESIGQLGNLENLVLYNNQLAALPESIGQLGNLKTLGLAINQLAALPESIGQLVNLETLNLAFNQLAALPESIGQLGNLENLALDNNQLAALPESIGQLVNLESLNLAFNQLAALPESIGQLVNLTSLEVDEYVKTEGVREQVKVIQLGAAIGCMLDASQAKRVNLWESVVEGRAYCAEVESGELRLDSSFLEGISEAGYDAESLYERYKSYVEKSSVGDNEGLKRIGFFENHFFLRLIEKKLGVTIDEKEKTKFIGKTIEEAKVRKVRVEAHRFNKGLGEQESALEKTESDLKTGVANQDRYPIMPVTIWDVERRRGHYFYQRNSFVHGVVSVKSGISMQLGHAPSNLISAKEPFHSDMVFQNESLKSNSYAEKLFQATTQKELYKAEEGGLSSSNIKKNLQDIGVLKNITPSGVDFLEWMRSKDLDSRDKKVQLEELVESCQIRKKGLDEQALYRGLKGESSKYKEKIDHFFKDKEDVIRRSLAAKVGEIIGKQEAIKDYIKKTKKSGKELKYEMMGDPISPNEVMVVQIIGAESGGFIIRNDAASLRHLKVEIASYRERNGYLPPLYRYDSRREVGLEPVCRELLESEDAESEYTAHIDEMIEKQVAFEAEIKDQCEHMGVGELEEVINRYGITREDALRHWMKQKIALCETCDKTRIETVLACLSGLRNHQDICYCCDLLGIRWGSEERLIQYVPKDIRSIHQVYRLGSKCIDRYSSEPEVYRSIISTFLTSEGLKEELTSGRVSWKALHHFLEGVNVKFDRPDQTINEAILHIIESTDSFYGITVDAVESKGGFVEDDI